MKLLFDIGNSRCKCAEYAGADLYYHPPVAVNADDVSACIPTTVNGDAAAIVVASVRGDQFNRDLSDVLAARFGVQPVFVASERTACGVTTAYREAASLGVDRFLALIGAWRRVGAACVVADCGTAVTVDAINDNGVHQGGLIMPGLHLLQSSLGDGTDRLPVSGRRDEAAEALFARDTQSAIASGCRKMFTAAVGDAMRAMRAQLGGDAVLLATGGDGELLLEAAGEQVQYHPQLVIEGLAAFAERAGDCG